MVAPADRPATPRPDGRCRGQAVDRYGRDPCVPAAMAMAAAPSEPMSLRLPRSAPAGATGAADWPERRRPRDGHTAKRRRAAFPAAGAGHPDAAVDYPGADHRIVAETVGRRDDRPGVRLAAVAAVARAARRQATAGSVTRAPLAGD